MANFRELLKATKAEIREVDTAEADELRKEPGAVVLDVREADEYEQGAIPDALHIPRGTLETSIEGRVPDHDTPLIVHCAGGTRSAFAAKSLNELGYTNVVSVAGGFNKWKDEGPRLEGPGHALGRAAQPLQASPPPARGRRRRSAEVARLEGAAARRRRARLTGCALPRRSGRRHAGHHRHGRGRRVEPPAPDPAQHGSHR